MMPSSTCKVWQLSLSALISPRFLVSAIPDPLLRQIGGTKLCQPETLMISFFDCVGLYITSNIILLLHYSMAQNTSLETIKETGHLNYYSYYCLLSLILEKAI